MQVMPATAKSLGIRNLNNPEQSIRGGTAYLAWLYKSFSDIPDSLNRIKFMLASYNCGYGHMKDAQRLAMNNGLDPTVWSDNVEKMILALNSPENFNKPIIKYGYVLGIEPVNYVKEIFERYEHYKQFIPLE
ncbi:MAG: membrane-bound lytic murein transglycosylase F [Cyclobacteriaceae bacterium]|jgi:membrane-bound lytic murein transglycosylase F